MSNYVKVDVVCPCGRLLRTVTSNSESGSTTTSSTKCSSCKKMFQFRLEVQMHTRVTNSLM